LDENSIWHYSNLISTSHDLEIALSQENNELQFSFPLMKDMDFMYFEAIGEAEKVTYALSHRIAHVAPIKAEERDMYSRKKSHLFAHIITLFFAFMVLFTILGGLGIRKVDLAPTFFDNKGNKMDKTNDFINHPSYDSLLIEVQNSYNKFSLFKTSKTRLYSIPMLAFNSDFDIRL